MNGNIPTPAVIRSVALLVVSWLASLLVSQGIEVSDENQLALVNGIALAMAALYYVVVKALEKRFPWVGYLLGSNKQPVYVDPGKTLAEQRVDVVTATAVISKDEYVGEHRADHPDGYLDAIGVNPVSGNSGDSSDSR